jgi:RNA polymerase sigma-70 factor (ECF subfamily)
MQPCRRREPRTLPPILPNPLGRIKAGDRAAFVALMRRHNQKLYRTARSVLRDDAEAEDAVQEAWMVAYRSLAGFRGDAKLSTWLVRIVVNESIARLRKHKRDAEVIRLGHGDDGDEDTLEPTMDDAPFAQPEAAAFAPTGSPRPRAGAAPAGS